MEPGAAPWFAYSFAGFMFVAAVVEVWRAVRADHEDAIKSLPRLLVAAFFVVLSLYIAAREARLVNDLW